jgi:hypothetical protein
MSILASVVKEILGSGTRRRSGDLVRYARLHSFIEQRINENLYAETPDEGHTGVMLDRLEVIDSKWGLRGKHVLDIGCGRGVALQKLAEYGAIAQGLAFGDDFEECKRQVTTSIRWICRLSNFPMPLSTWCGRDTRWSTVCFPITRFTYLRRF